MFSISRNSLLRTPRILVSPKPTVRISPSKRFNSNTSARDPFNNTFNRERAETKKHATETAVLWRKLSIYVAIPFLVVSGVNAYRLWNEHWEHWQHMPPLEERVEYPYQNIRVKNYPWGNGDKTLFWNDKVNYHKKDE